MPGGRPGAEPCGSISEPAKPIQAARGVPAHCSGPPAANHNGTAGREFLCLRSLASLN